MLLKFSHTTKKLQLHPKLFLPASLMGSTLQLTKVGLLSIIADTTNIRSQKGINTHLFNYFGRKFSHEIHLLECQFHVIKILLNRVIKYAEGKTVAPDRTDRQSVYNHISSDDLSIECSGNISNVFVTSRAKGILEYDLK